MSDFGAIDQMISTLRSMGTLAEEAAPIIAEQVESILKASASAGMSPEGIPWAPKKARLRKQTSSERPMKNAASHIFVGVIGTKIIVRLAGPDVFHHFGAAGKPRRPVLPIGALPEKIGNAVRLGFVKPWRKRVGGGS